MAAINSPLTATAAIALLKRRWLPALTVLIAVSSLGMVGAVLKKPQYVAEGKLKFERLNPTSSLVGVGKEMGQLEPLVAKSSPLTTEAEVLRSAPVVQQTIDQLHLSDQKQRPLKSDLFLQKLVVAEVKGSDILKVTYRDENPALAAQVVNTLVDLYLKQNLLSKRSQAAAARQFIEQELPKAEQQVAQAEANLRRFKEANRVVLLKEETAAAVTLSSGLQEQIFSLRGQIADMDAQVSVLRQKLGIAPTAAIDMTILSQAPGTQAALKELQEVESQLALKSSQLQADHPRIIDLEEKRANLQSLLQTRIDQVPGEHLPATVGSVQMSTLQQDMTKEIVALTRKRQGLSDQLNNLLQSQDSHQSRSSNLPRLEQEQRELERKLEAAQSTYSQLLQKDGEVRVAENQNVGNAQIIAAAPIPYKPISGFINYLAALLLGLLASGGTVYALEARDKSVKTIAQSRQLTGYPLLGVIPDYSASQGIDFGRFGATSMIQATLVSVVGAAYRMLQANLKFFNSDKPLKVIALTSAVPKEGKSTVAAHLAATIAQSGQHVLLIDGDLHHPRQHKLWELSNEVGLSNMLVDQVTAKQAIKQVMPNLSVLTCGVMPPNAPVLLGSLRMNHLVEELSNNYDFVIIDAPPVNVAADAQILGKMADGVVFVIRPGTVEVGNVKFAKDRLEQSGQNILGIVVNGCIAKNEPDSRYHFMNQYYEEADRALISAR
jgi:polysaccharide biosynthesis transport protein